MNVRKENVYDAGSCSFCKSGKLNASKNDLIYPYRKIWVVDSGTVEARFCRNCLKELIDSVKNEL